MRSRWNTLGVCLLSIGLIFGFAQAGDDRAKTTELSVKTLDDWTRQVQTVTRPDGSTVTQRTFTSGIPWDEYVSALAAETDSTGQAAPMAPGDCVPPDADYDGDGFIGTVDAFPLHKGEYVADRPRVGAEFTSYIEASVEVLYEGQTETTIETEHFIRDDLTYSESVKDTTEFRKKYNGSSGVKLAFGLANLVPSFSFDLSHSSVWEIERQQTHHWERERARISERNFSQLRKTVQTGSTTIEPYAGRVQGQVMIRNDSEYDINLEISGVTIAIVAYSPFTGVKYAIGQFEFDGPYNLGFGEGNDFVTEFLSLTGLNTWDVMNGLAEAWVFDFELADYNAIDSATGQDIGPLLSTINQRNSRVSIHYGDANPRKFGQVSVFQPNDDCSTAETLLPTYVGAANVEFERMEDGTLVVKRINHRTNMHADRDFDDLTQAEQAQYGRWVVGFDYGPVNDALTELDLETTFLAPEDKIFFYYVTAADFVEAELPHDAVGAISLANDGSAPSEHEALDGVSTLDTVELEIDSAFQIHESYTINYSGSIYAAGCGILLQATYHGQRVAVDSLNDSYAVPDADFYGMQVKFGGMPWRTIGSLMSDESTMAEMVSWREYPYYDYLLRFKASPELLGDYPTRNLQVRNTKARQSFNVGFTGYNVAGQSVDCRSWVTTGFFHNSGEARLWYKIDNVDGDLDTFYLDARTGIDFDDSDDHRFPFAPEHLDFVDNDGDNQVDNAPLICPDAVASYELGTCVLDDRMGWYGSNPSIQLDRRWHYDGGGTSGWESVGSATEYTFSMSGDPTVSRMELRATNWDVAGSPSGSNFIDRLDGEIPIYQVGETVEAEAGIVIPPMAVLSDAFDSWIETPLGTVDPTGAAAEYQVEVTTSGQYVIWTRVRGWDSATDSFVVELLDSSGQPVEFGFGSRAHFRFEVSEPPYIHGAFGMTQVGHFNAYSNPTEWMNPIYYDLVPDTYTVRFLVREPGTQLDSFYFERYCPDADGDNWTTCAGDCNDNNGQVYPGRNEVCSTPYDDDCDNRVNEGCGGGGSPIFRKDDVQMAMPRLP